MRHACATLAPRLCHYNLKFVNGTLGHEGILRAMEGVEDRRAGWDDALVYVDVDGELHTFGSQKKYTGEIARGEAAQPVSSG